MSSRKDQRPTNTPERFGLVDNLADLVERHRGDHGAVVDSRAVRQVGDLVLSFDSDYGLVELVAFLGKGLGYGFPDPSGTSVSWESEGGVGSPTGLEANGFSNQGEESSHERARKHVPVTGDLLPKSVLNDELKTGSGDTFSQPVALHL